MLKWYIMVLALVTLDQLTKTTVVNSIPELFVKNFGSAFSIMIPIQFTIILSFLFIGFIIYLVNFKNEPNGVVWGIALSGAIGNLIDRINLGYVIDFIHIGNFPVFNLADVYLTVSAILLLLIYFKND